MFVPGDIVSELDGALAVERRNPVDGPAWRHGDAMITTGRRQGQGRKGWGTMTSSLRTSSPPNHRSLAICCTLWSASLAERIRRRRCAHRSGRRRRPPARRSGPAATGSTRRFRRLPRGRQESDWQPRTRRHAACAWRAAPAGPAAWTAEPNRSRRVAARGSAARRRRWPAPRRGMSLGQNS